MDLEACREKTGEAGKGRGHAAADDQGHDHADAYRQSGKVKNMSEQGAGIDSFMHDHGRQDHAGTDHSPDRQIRTAQQDQAADAQGQEHTGRSRLQDVQDIGHGQQFCMLDDRCQNTQDDKNTDDGDVKAIGQEELFDVESIFVVLPFLLLVLREGESGQAEQVDQMIAVHVGVMPAVFDFLQCGLVL